MRARRRSDGKVTGYVFKLIRESMPGCTQERLAADLGVDRATIQGWETGRRPFTAVPFGQTVALRHHLTRLGADRRLLRRLNDAAEADFLLSAIIPRSSGRSDFSTHPLAYSVLTHAVTEMVNWAVTGRPPDTIAERISHPVHRRGPVPTGPALDAEEKAAFFAALEIAAGKSVSGDDRHVLLHRQACFLAGLGPSADPARWLGQRRGADYFLRPRPWSPRWADARSVATALAQQGDPAPLRDFIAHAHPDEACQRASLNYWAYWVGEITERQHDDGFMVHRNLAWRGTRLLRHLTDRLTSGHRLVDLNVHTVWLLLSARRGLVHDDPSLSRTLYQHGERLLDEDAISIQSRKDLASVLYGLRMEGVAG